MESVPPCNSDIFSKKFHSHAEDYQASVYPIDFWEDDRLTVYGAQAMHGLNAAEAGALLLPQQTDLSSAEKKMDSRDELEHPIGQTKYTGDLIRWLDDDAQIHPCNIQQAFAGYEALEAMCISALEHRRVDLPMKLELGGDINERMRRELPEVLRKKASLSASAAGISKNKISVGGQSVLSPFMERKSLG